MFSLVADILIVFYDFVLLALIGVGLVFLAHYLNRRRNKEFLYALDQIINKKDYEKKTDKKSDE